MILAFKVKASKDLPLQGSVLLIAYVIASDCS